MSSAERIAALDIIRGFALLGVLLINNHYFFRTPSQRFTLAAYPLPGLDAATDWILELFFSGKSVTLFSFLFGIGLAIQLERADEKGISLRRYAVRRLSALLLFGMLHIVLLWMGDILHIYALLGFVLLLFLRSRPRTVMVVGLVCMVLPWLVSMLAMALQGVPGGPGVDVAGLLAMEQKLRAYQQGTWLEAARYRLQDFVAHSRPGMMATFLPYALGLFLLGLWAWRRGILRDPNAHARFLARFAAVAFPLGLILTLAPLLWRATHMHQRTPVGGMLRMTGFSLGTPLMALSYAAVLLLLLRREVWLRRLAPLGAVGRMALTNYLGQSLVMTWIYNGYGLGWYGKLGSALGSLICLVLYGAQILASRWWLRRHRFGPVEWLWRTMTYGRLPSG